MKQEDTFKNEALDRQRKKETQQRKRNKNEELSEELEERREEYKRRREAWRKRATVLAEELESPLKYPDLMEAMGQLAFKLKPYLDEYDAIIGDDTSGRLPTLFMRKVANAMRSGDDPIDTYFVAGGTRLRSYDRRGENKELHDAVKGFAKERSEHVNKALVVSEIMGSGGSMAALVRVLQEAGIDPDVASVSIYKKMGAQMGSEHVNPDDFARDLGVRVFYGSRGKAGNRLHGMHDFQARLATGITKQHIDGVEEVSPHAKRTSEALYESENIKKAREELDRIAEEVVKIMQE